MGWQGHEIKTPPILHLRKKKNNHKALNFYINRCEDIHTLTCISLDIFEM